MLFHTRSFSLNSLLWAKTRNVSYTKEEERRKEVALLSRVLPSHAVIKGVSVAWKLKTTRCSFSFTPFYLFVSLLDSARRKKMAPNELFERKRQAIFRLLHTWYIVRLTDEPNLQVMSLGFHAIQATIYAIKMVTVVVLLSTPFQIGIA